MGLLFLMRWWYFDVAAAASERVVRSRRDALRFHVWTYAHFPLYLGVVVAAVGVQRLVTVATRSSLTLEEVVLMIGAALVVVLAMSVIGALSRVKPAEMRDIEQRGGQNSQCSHALVS
jgi:low temperature requirement protein LtrA